MTDLFAEQWFSAWPCYEKNCNTKEVTTDFTFENCNKESVADLFCLYVKYYSGGKYTAMHWVSMSAKFMVYLIITLQVTSLSLPFLFIPIFIIIVPREIKAGTVSLIVKWL